MNYSKLIYDIREATASISDDRYIDDRYITQLINSARAAFLRNLVSRKPYMDVTGLMQEHNVEVELVNRSVLPIAPLHCTIMRSKDKLPALIYTGTIGNWWGVKSVDILHPYIESVVPERAGHLSFEFNVLYNFLNTDYYLYFLAQDNKDLKFALVAGIFEDPTEVDPDLEDYPITPDIWAAIKPQIVAELLGRPHEDPVNNSEPDRGEIEDNDGSRGNRAGSR